MNRAIELILSLVMIAAIAGCKSTEITEKKDRDPAGNSPVTKSEADLSLKEAQSRKAQLRHAL